jgi:GNAT superfamily N-acetyltransferase
MAAVGVPLGRRSGHSRDKCKDESMASRRTNLYSSKELSSKTWPDFQRLFSCGNGWDYCACMYFQRGGDLPASQFRTRAERRVRNHQDKCKLVEQGRAHGILVYAEGEPMGWCQYGRADELPLPASRGRSQPPTELGEQPDWRITCFVTDKRHRRSGVAGVALHAALEAIRRAGGGLVEGYPIAHWDQDVRGKQLIREYGRSSVEVRRYLEKRRLVEVVVDGVGLVAAARGTFGHVSTQGTVSMFAKESFKAVGVVSSASGQRVWGRPPESHVVVQRRLRTRTPP